MVLLTLESTELYNHLLPVMKGTEGMPLLNQIFHHKWHGLHLWELVQPVFMFVAGTAMAFSIKNQREHHSWEYIFKKVLKRCGWLFF